MRPASGCGEAHLHNGQVHARALFAAVPRSHRLRRRADRRLGDVSRRLRLELVVGWVAIVAFANWVSARRAMAAAAWGASRNARLPAAWTAVAEAVGLAGLWASLPSYAFATQGMTTQLVMGGAMAGMTAARDRLRRDAVRRDRLDRDPDLRLLRRLLFRRLDARSAHRPDLFADRRGRRVQRHPAHPLDLRPDGIDRPRPDAGRIDPPAAQRI